MTVTLSRDGYLNRQYAESFSDVGRIRELRNSGGWLIERPIAQGLRDAIGPYPLFCCADWSALQMDLDECAADLVSAVVVTDPFGGYDRALLDRTFNAVVRPFKTHMVTDLDGSSLDFVDRDHRRKAALAMGVVDVERVTQPESLADDWWRLYRGLVDRRAIRSMANFTRVGLKAQLSVPGLVAFRATAHGETGSISLWMVQGEVAYYHLGASSDRGYAVQASFALFWFALEQLRSAGVHWLDLGGVAGPEDDDRAGLARFKRGWATGTRQAYLCGSIWDQSAYDVLATSRNAVDSAYFPAYRVTR